MSTQISDTAQRSQKPITMRLSGALAPKLSPTVTRKPIKIKLIAFENGLVSMGLRRISSYTKQFYDDVATFFYDAEGNSAFIKNVFFQKRENTFSMNQEFLDICAQADVVGVSCMSKWSDFVVQFIKELRDRNPNCFIVWGGAHAIMDPEHCIKHADAVCTGQEGEKIFVELLDKMHSKESYKIPGFWFRAGDDVIRNSQSPLLTADELDANPFQDFSDEILYVTPDAILPTDKQTYLNVQGTKYTTIWSIGCPFQCSYCGNTKFLANDAKYGRARYQRPETIVTEIREILKKYDFISFIEFQDDNFFLIQEEDILLFAKLYKEHIGLPFFIPGIFPGLIRNEAVLDALIDAGLRKVRMGIQSGSEKTLKMFKRPTSRDNIVETANILISKYPRISPPFFDIIMDIPGEDEKEKNETLSLLQSFPRPFYLYIYSLRVIPNTKLYEYSLQHPELEFLPIQQSYGYTFDKKYSLQLHLVAIGAPKRWIDAVPGIFKKDSSLPLTLFWNLAKLVYFGKRGFNELKIANLMPVSIIFPGLLWHLYRLRLIRKHAALMGDRHIPKSQAHRRPRRSLAQTSNPGQSDRAASSASPQ